MKLIEKLNHKWLNGFKRRMGSEFVILILFGAILALVTLIKFTEHTPTMLLVACGVFIISGILSALDIFTPLSTHIFVVGVTLIGLFVFAMIFIVGVLG